MSTRANRRTFSACRPPGSISLRRARSVDPQAIDTALALALSAWAIAEPGALDSPWRTIVLLAMTSAVAWRRRRPLAVLTVAVVGVVLQPRGLALPEVLALLIAIYSAALYGAHRLLTPALLLVAATALAALAGNLQIPKGVLPFVVLAPVWLAGSAMRRRELRAEDPESVPIAWNGNAKRRCAPNGRGSPASCTTSSPTPSASWCCKLARPGRS